MKHALLSGKSLTFIAPMGGVQAGHAYQAGSILLIATKDAAADRPFIGAITGVHRIAKPTDEAWTQGDALYWDESAENFTTDDDGGNNLEVGVAADDVAMSAAMGNVRLHGLMVAPGGGAPSESVVQSITVPFTDAQIRGLPTGSPITLAAAAGAGKALVPIGAVLVANIAVPYSNISTDSVMVVSMKPQSGSLLDATAYLQNDTTTGDDGLTRFLTTVGRNIVILNQLSYASPDSAYGGAAGIQASNTDFGNSSIVLYVDNPDDDFDDGDAANTLIVTVNYIVVDI